MAKTRFKFNDKNFRRKIYNPIAEEQTNRLIVYAQEELDRIVESREFDDRTKNLVDSYLWCVYFKGVLKGSGTYKKQARKESYLHEWSKENRIPVNGRKLVNEFKRTYKAQKTDGKYDVWEIVFAACAPYGAYLEAGFTMHGKRHQFDVMVQRFDHIKNALSPLGKVTLYVSPPK